MKKITINDRTFEYQVFAETSEYGTDFTTEFYEGTETYVQRKYLFFGEKQTLVRPKNVFTFNWNIEDPLFTKKQVREKLERQVELLGRAEEIAKGEII